MGRQPTTPASKRVVAGIVDEIGLVEQVDELLGTHPQAVVSLGQVLKAMILNGLGFLSVPLYLFSQFFEGKAMEHLLGDGIAASHLNDDRLGRTLDCCYDYGVTKLFTTLALRAADKFGVEHERVHVLNPNRSSTLLNPRLPKSGRSH
jgi:transposase